MMTVRTEGHYFYFKWDTRKKGRFEIWAGGRSIYGINVSISGGSSDLAVRFDKVLPYFPNQREISIGAVVYDGQNLATVWESTEYSWTIPEEEGFVPSYDVSTVAQGLWEETYIKGESSVSGLFTNITPKYGATITSIKMFVGDEAKTGALTPDGATITIAPSKHGKSLSIIAEVTDSRNFTTTKHLGSIDVYLYDYPKIEGLVETGIIAKRASENDEGNVVQDGTGELLYIAARMVYSGLGGANKCTMSYRLKQTNGTWSNEEILLKEGSSSVDYIGKIDGLTLDKKQIYYIELKVKDTRQNEDSATLVIPTEEVFMEKAGSIGSISFGGRVTKEKAFEVYTEGRFYGGLVLKSIEAGEVLGLEMYSPNGTPYIITVSDAGALQIAKKGE